MNKKALSFVEIIISVAIIVILATIGLSYKDSFDENKFNTKVESDLATLNNSFLAYKQENSTLPSAKSNNNYFKIDSSYAHDENDDAFWVHGFVTDWLIPKKYLNYLPLDPRTNQFYAYWKTLDPKNPQFEFAWVVTKDWESQSIVSWNYDWKALVGLIREYNWPQFIFDKSTQNFPFNPTERLMTAKIGSYSWSISLTIDWNTYTNDILNRILTSWDKIKVNSDWFANIYYSDGSRSTLESNSELVLNDMKYKSNDNLLTKISLKLKNGSIWTKATKLNPDGSEFEITTQDATAAVRWTTFKIGIDNSWKTEIEVDKWNVKVFTGSQTKALTNKQKISINSPILPSPVNDPLIKVTKKEILLPSNIKPEITKITSTWVTISQAKEWYYIKNKDNNKWECDSNWKCSTTWLWNEIKLCTKIWINEENCSEEIKIENQLTYEKDTKTLEEKELEKLKSIEYDKCRWVKVWDECYDLYAKLSLMIVVILKI